MLIILSYTLYAIICANAVGGGEEIITLFLIYKKKNIKNISLRV